MLWLCLHLPRLPLEALGLGGEFDVVTEQRGASRWLITAAPGVSAGMPLGTALSLQPLLRAHTRHVKAERSTLQSLAHRLYHYGTPVHAELREFDETGRVPLALLWLEVSASLRLFGGYPNLQAKLSADFADGRHQVWMAVAPTRAAAALFACHGGGVKVRGPAALARRLASRPIEELPWRRAQLEALRGVGLQRIGELRALPRKSFARRFGVDRLLELDRLYGDAPEPAEAIVPSPTFQRRIELPAEVEQVEALQFPLRRLAYDLQGWLRARDVSVRELRLDCLHARQRAHGRTTFTLRFLDAHRDAMRIFNGLAERLAREPLGTAVRALELRVTELGAAQATQTDLFDSGNGQSEWTAAVERISARLGAHVLWTPAPQADQRPEHAWRNDGEMQTISTRPRPLWLLHHPQVLPGEPEVDANVERIESGWWDGADQRRDYYVVEWQQRRVWVFRTRDDERWFLHGLWG